MSFNAKTLPTNGGKKLTPPLEPGAYAARVVALVLMGIQKNRPFKGETKAPQLRIRITYELLDEFLKDEEGNDMLDKPRWLTQEIAFHSLKQDKATSTKVYYALDPDETHKGDFSKLVGAVAIVTVGVEKDKRPGIDRVYEKVLAVSSMRAKEAAKAPQLVNEPYLFDFYDPDMAIWDKLPEWLQDKLKAAVDFEGGALQKALIAAGKNADAPAKEAEEPVDEDDGAPIDLDDDEKDW
jgi:hypothetical protein